MDATTDWSVVAETTTLLANRSYSKFKDRRSQMIESYQCATVQELTLRTHACFLLQYAELITITTFPSFIVCMLTKCFILL